MPRWLDMLRRRLGFRPAEASSGTGESPGGKTAEPPRHQGGEPPRGEAAERARQERGAPPREGLLEAPVRAPRARPRSRVQRFDSVAEIVELCRARHPEAEVQTANEDEGFILRIREGSWSFEALIVHFEGEGCYAVTLPEE